MTWICDVMLDSGDWMIIHQWEGNEDDWYPSESTLELYAFVEKQEVDKVPDPRTLTEAVARLNQVFRVIWLSMLQDLENCYESLCRRFLP